VLPYDAMKPGWTQRLLDGEDQPVRLVFCDPPYRFLEEPDLFEKVRTLVDSLAEVTEPGGVFVLRTTKRAAPPVSAAWLGPSTFGYGSMSLHFYERGTANPTRAPESRV
jgi:16S rRNA G966 N2-methylase RsmD